MFTARYGLIPYIKEIAFGLYKVNLQLFFISKFLCKFRVAFPDDFGVTVETCCRLSILVLRVTFYSRRSLYVKPHLTFDKTGNVGGYNVTMRCVRATTVAAGNQISITYSECVFVALGVQHVMSISHIANCGLTRSTICFHIIS